MSQNLVSVIVPTYNRAYCLARAINSALAQTHPEIEVIVVDDGSTDSTPDVLAQEYGDNPRVHYIRRSNGGAAAARNSALRLARGEFVGFLDSDDVWMPWKIELQLACLAHFPEAGMIWSDMQAVDVHGNVTDKKHLRSFYTAYRYFSTNELFSGHCLVSDIEPNLADAVGDACVYVGSIHSAMLMGNLVHTSTALLRRERLQQVGFFDEELKLSGEDHDFHLRTCREGPVSFIDMATIRYQSGGADRLSQHHLATAHNYLATLKKALACDSDRSVHPNWIRARAQARAHAWVGELLAESGDYGQARAHLARALLHDVRQLRTLALFLLLLLPGQAGSAVRRGYRSFKAGVARLESRPSQL